jgi:hypothetical protein
MAENRCLTLLPIELSAVAAVLSSYGLNVTNRWQSNTSVSARRPLFHGDAYLLWFVNVNPTSPGSFGGCVMRGSLLVCG